MNHRGHSIVDDVLSPQRSQTKSGDAENQSTNGNALIPSGIGQLEERLIGNLLVADLTYNTKDVNSRDDDRCSSNDGASAVERVVHLKSSNEDVHLSYES